MEGIRSLRGLAIGVTILAVLVMSAFAWFDMGRNEAAVLLGTAFAGTAMFAIGAAVILFAAERDDGTIVLLQLLPQRRGGLLFGKLAAGIVMTVVIAAALIAASIAVGGFRIADGETWSTIATQGTVFVVEALVWGVFVAMLCPNPLLAAVLGIAAASVSPQIAIQFNSNRLAGFSLSDFQAATPARLILAAVAGALDVWLGLRWINSGNRSQRFLAWRNSAHATFDRSTNATEVHANRRPGWLRSFSPLLWQTVRQSWKTIVAATFIGFFLSITVQGVWSQFIGLPFVQNFELPFTLLFLPALIGALTFRADQRNRQYRFLAEHAGRPRMMWAARQFVGVLVVVALGLVAHGVAWKTITAAFFGQLDYELGIVDSNWTQAAQVRFNYLREFASFISVAAWSAWLTAYALGQLFSLIVRSPVLAGMMSLGAAVLVSLWTYVVIAWQLSPLCFIAPVAAAALLGTWLRVKDWVVDRNAVLRWLFMAGAVIAPMAIMLCFVPSARMTQVTGEIPTWTNVASVEGLSLEERQSLAASEFAAGQRVLDQYQLLATNLDEDSTLTNEEVDERIKELSREVCRLPANPLASARHLNDIAYYIHRRFEQLVERDLDAALEMLLARERFENQRQSGWPAWRLADEWQPKRRLTELPPMWLKWVTAEGQTAERVKRALGELREIDRRRPTLADGIVNSYLAAKRVIRGEDSPSFLSLDVDDQRLEQWLAFLAYELPGEQARAEKALALLASEALDFAYRTDWTNYTSVGGSAGERAIKMANWRGRLRRFYWHFEESSGATPYAFVMEARLSNIIGRWPDGQQLRLNMAAQTSYFAVQEFNVARELTRYAARAAANVAVRHAEQTGLALIAYRLEHGEYPDALDDLQPNYPDIG